MTEEDILRLAREAGFDEWVGTDDVRFIAVIERFATFVAAAERKACAKICETLTKPSTPVPGHPLDAWLMGTLDCEAAILARGDK